MIRALICLAFGLVPGMAQALILCIGVGPAFAFVSDGETAQFDYVGDGTFALGTALPLPLELPASSLIGTTDPIPFALTDTPCEAMGVTLPVTITLLVPSNGAEARFRGCCRDHRSVPQS